MAHHRSPAGHRALSSLFSHRQTGPACHSPCFPFFFPRPYCRPCRASAGAMGRLAPREPARLEASASDALPGRNPSSTPVPRLPTIGPNHRMPSAPCPSSERHGWPRGNSALTSCPSPRLKPPEPLWITLQSLLSLAPPPFKTDEHVAAGCHLGRPRCVRRST
jgi:hypothetical protein